MLVVTGCLLKKKLHTDDTTAFRGADMDFCRLLPVEICIQVFLRVPLSTLNRIQHSPEMPTSWKRISYHAYVKAWNAVRPLVKFGVFEPHLPVQVRVTGDVTRVYLRTNSKWFHPSFYTDPSAAQVQLDDQGEWHRVDDVRYRKLLERVEIVISHKLLT